MLKPKPIKLAEDGTPIASKKRLRLIAAIDIETISLDDKSQFPICITLVYNNFQYY